VNGTGLKFEREKSVKSENETKGSAARSFEELHIYQRARDLTNAIYLQTRSTTFAKDEGLVDQIRRAAVSIMSNVAEGFERGTTTEFIQFLYIAKGSCGEVRAQLQIALDQSYINSPTHAALTDSARRVSAMISNFIAHLQGSDYRGAKFHKLDSKSQQLSQKWRAAGQAAQLANLRAQAEYYQQHQNSTLRSDASTTSNPSTPSNPSDSLPNSNQ
jgi:four helix bundle protein